MKGCRPLTDAEVRLVTDTFGGRYAARDRALFVLGVRSGFRVSELLSLKVGDVENHGRISDRVGVARRNRKGKKEGHSVALHPEAREILAMWLSVMRTRAAGREVGPDTFLFASRKGYNRPITRRQALWVLRGCFDANELAGPLGTHSMRKTFANRVDRLACEKRQAGAMIDPLRVVQRALGHKNINSTLSYLSFREEDVEECILGT